MNTKLALILVCTGCLTLLTLRPPLRPVSPPIPDPSPDSAAPELSVPSPAFDPPAAGGATTLAAPARASADSDGIAATNTSWLAAWQTHYLKLVAGLGDREAAARRCMADLDRAYHGFVISQMAELSGLPPSARYDRLAALGGEIEQQSEALAGNLGLDHGHQFAALAAAQEALAAEAQYAEMNGNHEQRVGLLRLDQERTFRMANLFAANGFGPGTDARVREEIDPWYESQLRQIVGAEEAD